MATKLILNLKREYFEAIRSGEKREEYRRRNSYWSKRLEGREYDIVQFRLGYPKSSETSRIIERPYVGYKIKQIIHPHFGPTPAWVYAIEIVDNATNHYFRKLEWLA